MSTEQLVKDALASKLTTTASGLLQLAQQLAGYTPALHNNAIFQSLDIMLNDARSNVDKYRAAMAPYGVKQL